MKFRLRIIGPAAPSQYYQLPLGETFVGNDPSCSLYIDDLWIAPQHLRIVCSNQDCELSVLARDTRFTQSNGKAKAFVKSNFFEPGDVVQLGLHTLILEHAPDESPTSTLAWLDQPILTSDHTEFSHWSEIPDGLQRASIRFLELLPEIYRDETGESPLFLSHFLALFESITVPIEWLLNNFDRYLDPSTAPFEFLPWLERWFGLEFNETWEEVHRRAFLLNAPQMFAAKGTKRALEIALHIYAHSSPAIERYELDKTFQNVKVTENMSDASIAVEVAFDRTTFFKATEQEKVRREIRHLQELFVPILCKIDEKPIVTFRNNSLPVM